VSQPKSPSNEGFSVYFKMSFLHPKYWGVWLTVSLLVFISLFPARWVDPLLAKLGILAGRRVKSARKRAAVNLYYCFPQWDKTQREQALDNMFAVVLPVMLTLIRTVCWGAKRTNVVWHNQAILTQAKANNERVIFLVPHAWAIDLPAILMVAGGHNVAAFIHNQNNELIDYLWNKARLRFGGRLHTRNEGIKPFIRSVKEGYWGYYLPDEDLGPQHSGFTDYFATYKATLPLIGRIKKISQATVIPLFPVYDVKTSTLHIKLRPAMQELLTSTDEQIARKMNEEIEALVTPNPEQYAWVLQYLRTRKNGDKNPYSLDMDNLA